MLKPQHWIPHSLYQKNIINSLRSLYDSYKDRINEYSELIDKLFYLNLDDAYKVLAPFYSHTGRPAKFQAEILRSLVAMTHLRIYSITKWVKKLRTDKILAIICGFDPDDIPGIGTFYDFLDRFWLANSEPSNVRVPHSKPKKPSKQQDKLPPRHPNVVRDIVRKITSGRNVSLGPQKVISILFSEIAVKPSIKMGLVKPNSVLTSDGAPLESPSNPYGKKLCDCFKNGIKHCNCKRHFSDPSANWGWDSYHKRYFFGYTLYTISTNNNHYDLPLHFILPQANRHDSVSAVVALSQLKAIYPDYNFSYFIADSAHDNIATYKLCRFYRLNPIIDLNPKNSSKEKIANLDSYGRPICPLGLPMVNWGYNKDRCRIKWRCPALTRKNFKKQIGECPIKDRCSSSSYGRVMYTYPEVNPRLFTNPPRGSNLWNELYTRNRSSVERCIKRILVDYELEKARVYSRKQWIWRIALVCINIHLDAWIDFARLNIVESLTSWAEEVA
ncbi:transposase [bacterium]|nr:transposase [bacterium]